MPSLWHSVPALLLLPASISAVTLDCKHIRVDKQSFDLSALGGPKTVHQLQYLQPSISNTTFTIDICQSLKRTKGVPKSDECASGTRVCGIERIYNQADDSSTIERVIPIAGEFTTSHGRAMDPEVTRLKDSASNSDSELEGLRAELHGGKWPETSSGKLQKAIIEFHCDRDLTGNEGFEDDAERMLDINSYGNLTRRADDEDDEDDGDDEAPELPDLDKGKSLQFVSYKPDSDGVGVLRLNWKTKYACESAYDDPSSGGGSNKTAHWGGFTWFLIVLFLLAATYIIFGSWLNYNRYGARGWDLVPHGDAIRDIPYIVKEWTGGVVDKVKGGGGSRGGYSAV
ncbi:hypothetical protein LTR85_000112 [Meristemomyces frigidus]|nr:hypothetical protein LTR85_000112 [Meristemomyces frigidus]